MPKKNASQERQVCATFDAGTFRRIEHESELSGMPRAAVVKHMVDLAAQVLDASDAAPEGQSQLVAVTSPSQARDDETGTMALLDALNDHLHKVMVRDPERGLGLAFRSGASITSWAEGRAGVLGESPDQVGERTAKASRDALSLQLDKMVGRT